MKPRLNFRYLWIFAAGLFMALFLVAIFQNVTKIEEAKEQASVPMPSQDGSNTKAEVGDFIQIEGTDIFRSELYVVEDNQSIASYKGNRSVQNYIFFDSIKQSFYLLKPNNEGVLLSVINLTEANNSKVEPQKILPMGFAYLVADRDTNNDQRINQDDLKKIAISDQSGLRFKVLIEQVDRFNGASIIKNNRVFLFYLSANKLKAAEIDLRSQQIISTTELNNQP